MENARNKLKSKPGQHNVSTMGALEEEVFLTVLSKELKRLRVKGRPLNSTSLEIRDSEMQPLKFFESCLQTVKRRIDGEFSMMTLRKFFNEVGLPFFDEEPEPHVDCGHATPLTALLKLGLQFGIFPFFKMELSKTEIRITKNGHSIRGYYLDLDRSEHIAERWKLHFFHSIQNTSRDTRAFAEIGAVLEDFHIQAGKDDVLRLARNYDVMKVAFEVAFEEYSDSDYATSFKLSEWSEYANSTYFDLLDPHAGNSAQFEENHIITFAEHFFEPLLILIRDERYWEIFIDYIRIYLLINEFSPMIKRTACAVQGNSCKHRIGETPSKYCTRLVSGHLLQRGVVLHVCG